MHEDLTDAPVELEPAPSAGGASAQPEESPDDEGEAFVGVEIDD